MLTFRRDRRLLLWSVAIFCGALAYRVFLAWRFGYFSKIEPDEMVKIAYSLASTGQFANPYLIPTGPTAHTMPLYPLFLAVLFKIFGTGLLAERIKILCACATSCLRCALLPGFAQVARLPLAVGIVAGCLSGFFITALQTDLRGSWDHPWQALVLLVLTWMTIRIWQSGDRRTHPPLGYYLTWGFAVLLSISLLPVLLGFLILGAIACPHDQWKGYLRAAGLLFVSVVLCLAPWAWRNYRVFGTPVLRGNLGLELWVSNGPGAGFDITTNLGEDHRPHPSIDRKEAILVAQLGEAQYNRQKLLETKRWVREHPAEFLELTLRRFVAWWFPPGGFLLRTLANAILGILAFIGLFGLLRVNRLAGALFSVTWLTFPLIYYFIQWSTKYRYPMDWEICFGAAIPLAAAIGALWARLHPGRRPQRL